MTISPPKQFKIVGSNTQSKSWKPHANSNTATTLDDILKKTNDLTVREYILQSYNLGFVQGIRTTTNNQ